jgi:hypothetical protein
MLATLLLLLALVVATALLTALVSIAWQQLRAQRAQ